MLNAGKFNLVLFIVVLVTVGLFGSSIFTIAGQAQEKDELEIFSWWAGWEAPALNALINLYEQKYPDVKVINAAVAGGAGIHAKAVLKTRILGGYPPDTFQVHAGQELIGTWVKANRMEDLTRLYKEEDWLEEVFPQKLIDLLSTKEGIWSVPLTIHRSNIMWYIPDNLKKWGVEPPGTWDEFLNETAPKLEEQGIIPLAMGINWTAQHLWESVGLAVLGPDKWEALWSGELNWTSPEAVKVWEVFDKILEYTPENAPSLSSQDAASLVSNGKAGFYITGDWQAGYMVITQKLKPKEDFDWVPSPGTKGVFMIVCDSFGLPKGAPHRENNIKFLKLVGSKEGSDIFNPPKGSISPRLDSDLSKYGAYQRSAIKDWRENRIVGSLVHGVVGNEGFMNDFATVIETFLFNRNPDQVVRACQALAIEYGIIE